METDLTVRIGVAISGISTTKEEVLHVNINRSVLYKASYQTQILLTLIEYLLLQKFDKAFYVFTGDGFHRNGTLTGIIKYLNRSEIDIGFPMYIMEEEWTRFFDFTYPFQITSHTFMTARPEYKPDTWSILQTISLPVWIAIVSSLMAMLLICFAYFRSKYSFETIMLHVWAVFLRQNSILNPSLIAGKFLIFSWVVGAMFLCLAYDSVFLSFLSFPPINRVTNVAELARRVEEGDYQCLAGKSTGISYYIKKSNETNLKIISKNMLVMKEKKADKYFILESRRQNLAYFSEVDIANAFAWQCFVSEDHFYERMAAIMVRKDFCCKKMLEIFVHRMMASGLYFKYRSNDDFFTKLALSSTQTEKDNSNRKLTLTDLAPAFIFLISGYFISILVFIGELLLNNKKKNTLTQIDKKREKPRLFRKSSV